MPSDRCDLVSTDHARRREPMLGGMAMLPAPAGTDILIADDDELISDVMAMTLESAGYRVTCAPGGRIALDAPVDAHLVLLDAHVPGTDFDDTRAFLLGHGVSVLVMSGEPSPPRGVAPEDFLSKPVELDRLLAAVQRIASTLTRN